MQTPRSFDVGILPDGTVVEGGATPDSAVQKVRATGFTGKVMVDEVPPSENPSDRTLQKMVETAVKRSGLKPIRMQQVMALTPEQAVARLRPRRAGKEDDPEETSQPREAHGHRTKRKCLELISAHSRSWSPSVGDGEAATISAPSAASSGDGGRESVAR